MKKYILILSLVFIGVGYSSSTGDNKYSKLNIYFYDWDERTRSRLSVEYVRENFFTHIIIKDENQIKAFVESLKLDKLGPPSGRFDDFGDVRLVIDLINLNGSISTYVANRDRFFDIENKKEMIIDNNFRDSFKVLIQ